MEAEVGIIQPQARKYLAPPEARRLKEGFSRRASGGSVALTTPFQTSSLQNYEKMNFCYFKPPSLWSFITAALGN